MPRPVWGDGFLEAGPQEGWPDCSPVPQLCSPPSPLPSPFMLLPTSETILEPQTPEKQQRPNHPLPQRPRVSQQNSGASRGNPGLLTNQGGCSLPSLSYAKSVEPSETQPGEEAAEVTSNLLIVMNTY